MVKDFFTEWEVADILQIDEDSAFELLEGVIEFEADEMYVLAQRAGIPVERLMGY